MRTFLIASVMATFFGAPAIQACDVQDLQQPGESRASANDRLHRLSNQENWAAAEVVFVGELLSIRRADGVQVEVQPIGSLKGDAGTEIVRYVLDASMLQCDLLSWPTMAEPGVYFANRASDGELRLIGMLTYDKVRDQALFDRLNKQLGLEPLPVAVRDGMDAPPSPMLRHWAWLTGTAIISLLVGISVGRVSRTASNNKNSRL